MPAIIGQRIPTRVRGSSSGSAEQESCLSLPSWLSSSDPGGAIEAVSMIKIG